MSKLDNLKRGFDNLITKDDTEVAKSSSTFKTPNSQTSKRSNIQTPKDMGGAKYKELRKCTLYLPPELMDSLAIMKVKTKKDLSILTAEAIMEYLKKNNYFNV